MDEKYKEALERAWSLREDGYKNNEVQEAVEYIFPQLKQEKKLKQEKNMKEFIQNELACLRALEDRYKELTEAIKWLYEEKKEEVEPITDGLSTEFQKQVSYLIASSINKEHEYSEGYVKWVSQSLLEYAKKESVKGSDEDEKIKNEILEYFTITRARDFVANPERQKWISYIEKQKEQTEELSTRLNGLMQEYVKSGKDEEEQEHRLKCYHLFWDALGDSEFFKQKEQKPRWEINNPHTTKWTKEMIDEKFEELVDKSDKDEKIRKEIIRFLKTELELVEEAKYYDSANSIKEWIVYLEKQKSDGKDLLYVCDKSYKIGYRDGKLADKWDDLDETYFQDVLWCIKQARKTAKTENDMGAVWAAEHWVKNIIEWKKTKNLMKNE